jgi:hypothetical protein
MRLVKRIILIIVIILAIATTYYLINRWSYAKAHDFTIEKKHATDTLSIGIIGDSWVAGQKLDSILHNALLKDGYTLNKIVSSGEGGANSELIYSNMFLDRSEPFSSNKVFYSNLKYCVVIAGVNDAIGQYGGAFYTHHVILIIKSLLKDNIRPVVVMLPEFGIQEAENEFNIFKRDRNIIFGHFTGNGFSTTIRDYRKMLSAELDKQHLTDSIVKVNFDSVIMNYQSNKRYYRNPPHLNVAGNQLFGKYIVKCIDRDIKSKK